MPDVTFKSDAFEKLTPVDDAINEMLGHDLAHWMHDKLEKRDFAVDPIINEDYGFGFWLKRDESYYWLWFTRYYQTDYDVEEDALWVCGISYDPGCLWVHYLRHRPDPATLATIVYAVHDILVNTPHIIEITWWQKDLGHGESSSEPIL